MPPPPLFILSQGKSRASLKEMHGLYVRSNGSLEHFTALRSLYLREATRNNLMPMHPVLSAGLRCGAAHAPLWRCRAASQYWQCSLYCTEPVALLFVESRDPDPDPDPDPEPDPDLRAAQCANTTPLSAGIWCWTVLQRTRIRRMATHPWCSNSQV